MSEPIAERPASPAPQQERAPGGGRWAGLLVAVPLIGFVGLAALFYTRLGAGDPSQIPSALIGKPVPRFTLPVLVPGKPGADPAAPQAQFSDADLRQGHVTLVNIFASWCEPCRYEHPQLLRLAADRELAAKGVRVIGIAYKDEPANTLKLLADDGNPYAVIGADRSGRAAIDWGVYGVPETFLVRGDGTIVKKFIGPMTEDAVTGTILPEIAKLLPGAAPASQ